MKHYLNQKIPVGTPVNVARQILQSKRFEVSLEFGQAFTEEGKVRRNLDYLYGDRHDGFIFQRRWQVAVVFKENKVTEILVSTAIIAL